MLLLRAFTLSGTTMKIIIELEDTGDLSVVIDGDNTASNYPTAVAVALYIKNTPPEILEGA